MLLLGCSAPLIVIHFLDFIPININSCFHHSDTLAPYRNTATAHGFMAETLFFPFEIDFQPTSVSVYTPLKISLSLLSLLPYHFQDKLVFTSRYFEQFYLFPIW